MDVVSAGVTSRAVRLATSPQGTKGAAMDRNQARSWRTVERSFVGNRLSEKNLACAYERLVPVAREVLHMKRVSCLQESRWQNLGNRKRPAVGA